MEEYDYDDESDPDNVSVEERGPNGRILVFADQSLLLKIFTLLKNKKIISNEETFLMKFQEEAEGNTWYPRRKRTKSKVIQALMEQASTKLYHDGTYEDPDGMVIDFEQLETGNEEIYKEELEYCAGMLRSYLPTEDKFEADLSALDQIDSSNPRLKAKWKI